MDISYPCAPQAKFKVVTTVLLAGTLLVGWSIYSNNGWYRYGSPNNVCETTLDAFAAKSMDYLVAIARKLRLE